MDNEKHHDCGCGHSHDEHDECGCDCCQPIIGDGTVDDRELSVLGALLGHHYLPVSRFVMCSSESDEVRFTALAPVYLETKADSMETVKERAALLLAMEAKALISLDYDEPLQGYDYETHTDSDLFHYLESTVQEGRKSDSFLCDTAEVECGSISITERGLTAVSAPQ